MTGGNGISLSNTGKPFLDMTPLPTSTSRVFRAIIAFICQYFLIFTLFPLGLASGASEQHPSLAKLIPDSLISLGSEDGRACAILVEKDSQSLMVYEHKDTLSLKHEFPCSTGEVAGKKQKSGDRKTPEGVYFLTKAFEKRHLSVTYGNRAFVMDYPNLLDRKFGRGGYNIWLHGSNKPIKSRDSNGCVVMANDDLETLARCIELNRTPIIIKQELNMVQAESQLADKKDLTSFLEDWQTAFVTGDRAKYSACYSKPSGDLDILWRVWDRVRTTWQRAQIPFDMKLQDLALVRDNPCVVALFDQATSVGTHVSVVGTKKLFLEKNGKTWKIIGEEYQPGDSDHGSNGLLVTALNRLDRLQRDHRAIADLVAEWADAWSSKDIRQYRVCYDPDFRVRGMDLKAWIGYKERLNRRYDSIRVWIGDLKIQQGPERSTVTFLQRYHSSGHQSVGIKCLRLKRIGGAWKIHRETWHTIHK
jgi:murein L,D-transpeptidase YafK